MVTLSGRGEVEIAGGQKIALTPAVLCSLKTSPAKATSHAPRVRKTLRSSSSRWLFGEDNAPLRLPKAAELRLFNQIAGGKRLPPISHLPVAATETPLKIHVALDGVPWELTRTSGIVRYRYRTAPSRRISLYAAG